MDFLNSPYQSESSSTDSHFLPASKKISKTKITRNNSATSPSQKKNYDKTPTKDKEGIMSAIMDELLELRNLEPFLFEHEIMYNLSEWRGYLGELNHKEFNTILLKVMPKFKPDLTLDQQNLTQLRKKVKGWFDNEKKAETRGGGLVRDEELPELKNVLKKIISDLHKMKTRSFDYLRKQVIPVMEKIHEKSSNRKTKNNMFSKRFWHSFLHKEENADLKALWEGIPKKNAKKSGTAKAQESDHSESDSELTLDVSRKSSGFQEIPEPSCETFVNGQHGGTLQIDPQLQTLQQQMNFIDFDSLNSQGFCYVPDMTSLELTDQSSFAFPPAPDAQDVKNCMEEEIFSDTNFTLSENFVTDFSFNGVKLVNLFKDCENDVQSPIENLLFMQDFDDFGNMMNSSEIQLGHIGY